ncbi:PAS domain-containing protein [Candidatus Saccharibacteria bacterium]|nr:PAS domain-containing protein [Candidatus Saccharibacteria bacterium]
MGLFGNKKKVEKPSEKIEMISSSSIATADSHGKLNEQVLKYIHEGVIIVDSKGIVLLANPAAAKLFGRSIEEIEGFSYDTSVSILDKNGNAVTDENNPIGFALKNNQFGETRDFDLVTLDSNKTTPVSIIIVPAEDENNNLIITFRDIAEELKKEAERNDFISTASHEMRTPVASIEGYLSLAMNPSTATVDQRAMEYLTKAHEASKHLGHLFQDLLDTTKMDESQSHARMEPVELVSLTKQIADGQIPNISAKGLGYQFGSANLDQTLGGSRMIDQLIYTNVDVNYLREIIDNLLENAIKYTPDGWITVSVKADDRNAQIIVKDTGFGIPRDEISHIFQKFYRIDNSDTREIGGTGLGLSLVKRRVEAMNGRIWVESEPGKGSSFFVSFPRISASVYRQQRFAMDNQAMIQARPQQKSAQDNLVAQIIAGATPGNPTPTAQITPNNQIQSAAQAAVSQMGPAPSQPATTTQPAATTQPSTPTVAPVQPNVPAQSSTPTVAPVQPSVPAQPPVQPAAAPSPTQNTNDFQNPTAPVAM